MKTLLTININLLLSGLISTQSFAGNYICKAKDGLHAGFSSWVSAPNGLEAEEFSKETLGASVVLCHEAPTISRGAVSDISGKKWELQGIQLNTKSHDNYIVFTNQQILHVQECGQQKVTHKFNAILINENSFKLSFAGVEGSCHPMIIPGFQDQSVITVHVGKVGKAPTYLSISEKRIGDENLSTYLFQEIE